MKTATLPAIGIEPDLLEAIEASLAEGETLSDFVEKAVLARLEQREQAAFVARGRASLEEWRRTGVSYSTEEVFSELREAMARKLAQARAEGRVRDAPPERE